MFGPRHEHRLGLILAEVNRAGMSVVLDAAVGLGQLAGRMLERGHIVYGLDSSFDAALHARRQGIVTVVGDMTRLPFRDRSFDVVTSGETLEHLDNDSGAVREFARVLAKQGTAIATVPALRMLWSASDDYYEHRRRYSRKELSRVFTDASFEVAKVQYWGFPVVLAYDTLFLLPMNKRRSRRNVEGDSALQSVARAGRSRTLVSLVRAAFAIDRLFRFIPFGPGLLLVARKLE
jgi:SAM-dependent methyltransferase